MSEQQCDSCLEYKKEGATDKDGYWYCSDCTEELDCQGKDFAHIDDEYNEDEQLCPACSAELNG